MNELLPKYYNTILENVEITTENTKLYDYLS